MVCLWFLVQTMHTTEKCFYCSIAFIYKFQKQYFRISSTDAKLRTNLCLQESTAESFPFEWSQCFSISSTDSKLNWELPCMSVEASVTLYLSSFHLNGHNLGFNLETQKNNVRTSLYIIINSTTSHESTHRYRLFERAHLKNSFMNRLKSQNHFVHLYSKMHYRKALLNIIQLWFQGSHSRISTTDLKVRTTLYKHTHNKVHYRKALLSTALVSKVTLANLIHPQTQSQNPLVHIIKYTVYRKALLSSFGFKGYPCTWELHPQTQKV